VSLSINIASVSAYVTDHSPHPSVVNSSEGGICQQWRSAFEKLFTRGPRERPVQEESCGIPDTGNSQMNGEDED